MIAFLTEELVLNKEVAEQMDNYRYYRIEYGGCNESCIREGSIWLPPDVDPDEIEKIISREEQDVK